MGTCKFKKVKEIRLAQHLTSAEVANKLGIDRTLYVRYESGERDPDSTRLSQIAQILGVPLADIAILPLRNVVCYAPGALDELASLNGLALDALKQASSVVHADSEAWRERLGELYQKHKELLDRIIDARSEALEFPDLGVPIENLVGLTVKSVTLDTRGEMLITQGLKFELALLEKRDHMLSAVR